MGIRFVHALATAVAAATVAAVMAATAAPAIAQHAISTPFRLLLSPLQNKPRRDRAPMPPPAGRSETPSSFCMGSSRIPH